MFHRAVGFIKREHLLTEDKVDVFESFIKEAEVAVTNEQKEEADLGEIPDEFLG